jgi:hypothetical protein
VGDTETLDSPLSTLPFQPLEVSLPCDEVVDLLYLHAAEPFELSPKLLASLVDASRPDLRRHDGHVPPRVERRTERRFGGAVHRRGVDDATAGVESCIHHNLSRR